MGNKVWTASDSDIPYTGYFRVKLIVAITNVNYNAPSANSLRAFPLTGQAFVVFARRFSSHFRLTARAKQFVQPLRGYFATTIFMVSSCSRSGYRPAIT